MTPRLVWLILYGGWAASEIYIAIATRTRRSDSEAQIHDRGSLRILWIVIVLSLSAAQWLGEVARAKGYAGPAWLRSVGIAALVAGISIRWIAIVSLGKSFSSNVAIRDSQTVYRGGLYRFVRHPSYVGLLLAIYSVGIHSATWLGVLVAVVPTTAAVLYRMHVEEIALLTAFGDSYSDYRKSTKRLIPGIY